MIRHKSEDDEPDTYHSRTLDGVSDLGGRYAALDTPRNIGAGDGYPMQPEDYPLRDHPELPDDFTDKVEEPTGDKFGMDLTTLSSAPPPDSVSPPPANSEVSVSTQGAASSSFRRRV